MVAATDVVAGDPYSTTSRIARFLFRTPAGRSVSELVDCSVSAGHYRRVSGGFSVGLFYIPTAVAAGWVMVRRVEAAWTQLHWSEIETASFP
jgi:hypothetical protein